MLSGFLRMLWENLLSPSSGIQEYPEKCVKKKIVLKTELSSRAGSTTLSHGSIGVSR